MFSMHTKRTKLARPARVLLAGLALAGFAACAEPLVVKDLDMFVDPTTAFVFVKMPQGWKFVGKLDARAMRSLPTGIHTSLLVPETERDARAARAAARTKSL